MQAIRKKDESQLGFLIRSALTASFSGSIAEVATIPFDTVKVRLQMQNTTALKFPII
jgi:hypothetical protein